MDPERTRLLADIERTLNFGYHSGGARRIDPPHSMGWRVLPFALTAQTDYPALLITGGRRIHIPGGAACFVRQSARHHVSMAGHTAGFSRWSHFNALVFGCIDVLSMFEVPAVFTGKTAARIGRINTALAALSAHPGGLQQAIARKRLGFALLQTLVEQSKAGASHAGMAAGLKRLTPVLAHIRENLSEPLTLAGLAREVHLSESRFHAVFKAVTGYPPQFYVQRLRLQAAQELLIEGEQPIKEIAGRVGHRDVFHFSRLFKQRCGLSPRAYRKHARATLAMQPGLPSL